MPGWKNRKKLEDSKGKKKKDEWSNTKLGGGNSNIFDFHPYLGKIPILTIIFFRWVETTNQ